MLIKINYCVNFAQIFIYKILVSKNMKIVIINTSTYAYAKVKSLLLTYISLTECLLLLSR